MKNKLSHLWLRRPRLGRRGKIVRNLLLALPFLLYLWGEAGYPLPAGELDFRRAERTYLNPTSELIYLEKAETKRAWEDGRSIHLTYAEGVGILEDRAVVVTPRGSRPPFFYLREFPLEEGTAVIPLEMQHLTWFDKNGLGDLFASTLLVVEAPAEAARGELVLDVTYRGSDYHRDCPMFDMGEGRWLVAVEGPDDSHSSGWYYGGAYTMTFYDVHDQVILEQRGTVPNNI